MTRHPSWHPRVMRYACLWEAGLACGQLHPDQRGAVRGLRKAAHAHSTAAVLLVLEHLEPARRGNHPQWAAVLHLVEDQLLRELTGVQVREAALEGRHPAHGDGGAVIHRLGVVR